MNNKPSKVGTILVMVVTVILNLNLTSCVGVPRQQYSVTPQPYPQQPCYSGVGQPPNPQSIGVGGTGPQVPGNMPKTRWGNFQLDGVLKEDWHYDPRTGKVTKKGQTQFQPNDPALQGHMKRDGVEMFPDAVPIGSEMSLPEMRTGGKRVPGNPPSIKKEGVSAENPKEGFFPEIDPKTGRWEA